MIYHYTTAAQAASVRSARVLRACPMLVYLDLMATRRRLLAPVVWFTTSDVLDGPILLKARLDGIMPGQPKAFWRFCCADDAAPLDLPAWAGKHGHPPELFRWMILTGQMAGSDYLEWRLAERDVPAAHWLSVETLINDTWHPE